jgi:hypothetical protein
MKFAACGSPHRATNRNCPAQIKVSRESLELILQGRFRPTLPPHITLLDPKLNVTIRPPKRILQSGSSVWCMCETTRSMCETTRNVKTQMPNEIMQGRPSLHPPVYQLCSFPGPLQSYGPELPHSCQAITGIPSTNPAKEDTPRAASLPVNPLIPPTCFPSSLPVIPTPCIPFPEPSISLKTNTNPINTFSNISSVSIPNQKPNPDTFIAAQIWSLNCAKNNGTTILLLQNLAIESDVDIICVQKLGLGKRGEPPTHPTFQVFSPSEKPKCAIYVRIRNDSVATNLVTLS